MALASCKMAACQPSACSSCLCVASRSDLQIEPVLCCCPCDLSHAADLSRQLRDRSDAHVLHAQHRAEQQASKPDLQSAIEPLQIGFHLGSLLSAHRVGAERSCWVLAPALPCCRQHACELTQPACTQLCSPTGICFRLLGWLRTEAKRGTSSCLRTSGVVVDRVINTRQGLPCSCAAQTAVGEEVRRTPSKFRLVSAHLQAPTVSAAAG